MPKVESKAGHHSFLETVKVLHKSAGPRYAAESLINTGANAGRQVAPVYFETIEQFYESMAEGGNPITDFEGKSKHFGSGVFGLLTCPFASALLRHAERGGASPEFAEVTDEMNRPSQLTRQLRIGEGAAASPFCAMHQSIRSAMGQRIVVAGRALQVFQLGCRTSADNKAVAPRWVQETGVSPELVDQVLEEYTCCFCFR